MSFYDICNTAYCTVADTINKLTGINLIGGEKPETRVAAFALGTAASYGTTAGLIKVGNKLFNSILKDEKKAEKTMYMIKNGVLFAAPMGALVYAFANNDQTLLAMQNNPVYVSGIEGIITGIVGAIAVDENKRMRNSEAAKQYKEHKDFVKELKRCNRDIERQYNF